MKKRRGHWFGRPTVKADALHAARYGRQDARVCSLVAVCA
jgi:hypothetical protein